MHLPPPNLPRFGGGERPPFSCKPPAPLTITIGQRLIFRPIIVPHPNHRDPPPSASPYPLRASLSVTNRQPIRAPFPPSGKGVGGKGKCAAATLGAILCAVRIDFRLHRKSIRIQHSRATGFSGRSPEPFLHPFVGTKGCPRRVGVRIKTFYKSSRRL